MQEKNRVYNHFHNYERGFKIFEINFIIRGFVDYENGLLCKTPKKIS